MACATRIFTALFAIDVGIRIIVLRRRVLQELEILANNTSLVVACSYVETHRLNCICLSTTRNMVIVLASAYKCNTDDNVNFCLRMLSSFHPYAIAVDRTPKYCSRSSFLNGLRGTSDVYFIVILVITSAHTLGATSLDSPGLPGAPTHLMLSFQCPETRDPTDAHSASGSPTVPVRSYHARLLEYLVLWL